MILIDYSDKRPIYEQIAERFQALILSGVLKQNEKLPSVRSLAMELSINPNTIQRAYSELERDGYLYSVKGRGMFVRADENRKERHKAMLLDELERQIRDCLKQGVDANALRERVSKILEEVTA